MKKNLFITIIVVIGVTISLIVYGVFFANWGERGWSKIANITIQEQGIKEIGELDGIKIYTYNLSDVSFLHITAKEMPLEELIKKNWMGVENLLHGQRSNEEICKKKATVYTMENYQIIYLNEILIYAPINADKVKIAVELKHFTMNQ